MAEDSEKAPKKPRGPGRPFQKGVSGNPGGMTPIKAEFRARARSAVDELVIDRWTAEVRDGGGEWVRCSELLAAYGYGKPASAPEDNDALRESGRTLPAGLTAAQVLAIARGEKP